MRKAKRTLAAVLVVTFLAGGSASAQGKGGAPATDYEAWAVELLQQYLRIDTTVPPGNELKAALFFKALFEKEGIPVLIDEFAPGRANVLATLSGSKKKRALILANHMDVVPADPARWKIPPFSGLLKDGVIYGRGSEDMKTEGILQALALVRLKREQVPLDRDVIFLGTADEEVNFAGALRAISPEGWKEKLAGAEYLITEGGENIVDAAGKPQYFGVEVGEKGTLWSVLSTTGTPGHGSRPIADSALNRLIRALDRIRQHRTALKVLPSVQKFFRDLAPTVSGERAAWYRDMAAAVKDEKVAATLYDDRDVSALLRNTVSITVVKAGYKTNVIPGTAEAELDIRLLPGEDPEAFLKELRAVIDDPTVKLTPPATIRPPNASSTDTELFTVIERTLARHYPGVPVTTKMLTGATESVLYRPLGMTAYGFTPLLTTEEEVATGHGDDERIQAATVRKSTTVFYEVVSAIAGR